ncbi:hypothetical protein Taro_036465 [Colocasia esculenta]|uniref:Uncharacterized protein n=1 Tax=Colocasia esculenta TaxID=4460 RepID=A0A843WLR3_COLES|nr:hypothetical protein [Colocasia esculenta]
MLSFQISVIDPVSSGFLGSPRSKRRYLGLTHQLLLVPGRKVRFLHNDGLRVGNIARKKCFAGGGLEKVRVMMGRKGTSVVVRANQGFGFNGGGGGGGWDRNTISRVLGNLALAIGLTYLTMTGQLGWFLDAIVSIWLLAVLLPIVGLGAFFWFAGRDIVQDTCPNCGNDFQIFKMVYSCVHSALSLFQFRETNLLGNLLGFPPTGLPSLVRLSMAFHTDLKKVLALLLKLLISRQK